MHWIDLGRISIHSQKDSVQIRGSLQKLPGADSPLSPAGIDVIFRKIKAAAGNRRLLIEFDNWTLNSATGAWEHGATREKRRAEATQDLREKAAGTSFQIEE